MPPPIRIFHGATSPAKVRVYAELPIEPPAGVRITGFVRGPYSEFGSTLPATFPLRDLGPGPSLLSEAMVTDPCFWSPESPAIYEATAEARLSGTESMTHQQLFALRAVGVKGKSFYRDAKRFVLRGVLAREASWVNFAACRQMQSTLVVEQFDAELLLAAARQGVSVVPLLRANGEELISEISRVSSHGLSEMAFIAADVADENAPLRSVAPGMLLIQFIERSSRKHFTRPAAWAHAVAVEIEDPAEIADVAAKCELPIIAIRPDARAANLAEARAASDVLQRDLAAHGDFAGYIA